jgi:WD40-like Beta Propeller Repeat
MTRRCGPWGAPGFLVLSIAALALAIPLSAQATFPGRNGKLVYQWNGSSQYRGAPGHTSIRTVDPRGRRVRVLRDCPRVDAFPDCGVFGPRYSPDGRRIAFTTYRRTYPDPPHFQAISVMASNGTGVEDHATSTYYYELAWSPAGDGFLAQRDVVSCCDPGGLPIYHGVSVFHTSLEGTELSEVASQTRLGMDWSSRGEIAFSRSGEPCPPTCNGLYVTRLGGTPRRLTRREDFNPSWSPNGRWLAFFRDGDIHLVRRDGRGRRRLTRRGGERPVWSPDGRWIAFIRDSDLYVVRTDGRGLRRLVEEPGDQFGGPQVRSVDWQPLPRRSRR